MFGKRNIVFIKNALAIIGIIVMIILIGCSSLNEKDSENVEKNQENKNVDEVIMKQTKAEEREVEEIIRTCLESYEETDKLDDLEASRNFVDTLGENGYTAVDSENQINMTEHEKLIQFCKTMQSNFKRANNNPANWRPGELGINTEIGKISVDNYAHKSFTIGRKPAGIDPKDGNVRIRRPIAKSTGQEDRRFHSFDPMPVRGSAKAVGAIAILDFANYAVDTYMTLSTFWDSNAFDDQMASFRKAIRAVNSQMNSIPDNYRKDTNRMGVILNYVFQGENTTKDKNIDKIGQNILSKSGRYDRTNKTYKPFIKR